MKKISASLLIFFVSSFAGHASVACEGARPIGSRLISVETQAAEQYVEEMVRSAGVSSDLKFIRTKALTERFPKADVDVTLRKMLDVYCQVVRAEHGLDEAMKNSRISSANDEILRPIAGPSEVARTNSHFRRDGQLIGTGGLLLALADDNALYSVVNEYTPLVADASDHSENEFLAETPPFINESNKYFVVVGSAISKDAAIKLMYSFGRKAPDYDFVVFQPYGSNTYYGVMMAKWVSKDVAQKALKIAKSKVAPDAYLWACPSMGDSC